MLDLSGRSLFDGNSYSDRAYFQQAVQGEVCISVPTLSKVTGELSIMVAAPVWLNGIEGGTVAGVVYFVPHETFLNDIMESIHISENSGAYMIDSTGTTIADTTLDTVSVQNIEQEAQQDSSLSALAALHADMRAGNSGYGSYEISGAQKYLAYAPVPQTDGWTVAVTAPVKDFLGTTYTCANTPDRHSFNCHPGHCHPPGGSNGGRDRQSDPGLRRAPSASGAGRPVLPCPHLRAQR
ncbi:MAG: cache domain-containing protein [Flavonifractor plautii]